MSILGGVLLLVIVLCYAFRKRQPCAFAKVVSGKGRVYAEVSWSQQAPEILSAMTLCYAAKIKWLIMSEPELSKELYMNILNSTLSKWPTVPDVEMLSSLRGAEIEFVVNLYKRGNGQYFVTNTIPSSIHSCDLVAHYFILLREIVSKLSKTDSESLRMALFSFVNKKIPEDSSVSGLIGLTDVANEVFQATVLRKGSADGKTLYESLETANANHHDAPNQTGTVNKD